MRDFSPNLPPTSPTSPDPSTASHKLKIAHTWIDQANFSFHDISRKVCPICLKICQKDPIFAYIKYCYMLQIDLTTFCTLFATFKIRNPRESINHAGIASYFFVNITSLEKQLRFVKGMTWSKHFLHTFLQHFRKAPPANRSIMPRSRHTCFNTWSKHNYKIFLQKELFDETNIRKLFALTQILGLG